MNKIIISATLVVLAILVSLMPGKGDAKGYENYLEALLQQQNCSVSTATKIDEGIYRCHEGTDEYVRISIEGIVSGDFDKDGTVEDFIIWGENFGGSGTFIKRGLFVRGNTDIVYQSELGDRVQIKRVYTEGNSIIVDQIGHARGDPLCCPTKKFTWEVVWDGETLHPLP